MAGDVYSALADRIRGVARDAARREGTSIERWKVKHADPLVIEQIDGDVVLEAGDPDFTVGDALSSRVAGTGAVGSLVWVAAVREESGTEWHAFDLVSIAGETRGVGSAMESRVFIGPDPPLDPPSEYVWVETGLGPDGDDYTLWIED